jgi:hypothetical protein
VLDPCLPPYPGAPRRAHSTGSGRPLAARAIHACFALSLALTWLAYSDLASAQRAVRIQAQSSFVDVSRVATVDGVEIRGRLLDDTEQPIELASIELELGAARARGAFLQCNSREPLRRKPGRPSRLAVQADAGGTFCVHASGARVGADAPLTLVFSGDAFHLGVRTAVPPIVPRLVLALAFEAPALELTLDRARHALRVNVAPQATPPPALAPVALELVLITMAKEVSLARAEWRLGEPSVEFSVSSEALGAPGPARLVARHRGSGSVAATEAEAVALRIAPVVLDARIERRDADGVLIEVGSESVGGLSAPGWVEAHAGSERLAATPLEAGRAQLAIELSSSDQPMSLQLRYRGDDPWWVPGGPVELVVPAGEPAAPVRWPWLVLLLPIGYLFVRALERPGFSTLPLPPAPAPPPQPVAEVELLAASSPASGWSGIVRDAHDATPIAAARISIVLPEGESQPQGPSTSSDAEGRFRLGPFPVTVGATLRVTARAHSELTRPLPPAGRIGVALVSRRRTLVRRLVDWARAAGAPWTGASEPTPAEVLDVALRRDEPAVADWARSIESAAFGQRAPDAQQEARLVALEPSWGVKGDRKR